MSERDDFDGYGSYTAAAFDSDLNDEVQGLADERSGSRDNRLAMLADMASVQIETSLVTDLSGTLHSLFDPVCDKTLPIYFGPLLGRLYLEGL